MQASILRALVALAAAGTALVSADPAAAVVPDTLPTGPDPVDAPAVAAADTLEAALSPQPGDSLPPVLPLGGADEDRIRLRQLTGARSPAGFLTRSSSTLAGPDEAGGGWRWITPRLRIARNSDIARSMNEGALWAGRGIGLLASSGLEVNVGPARLRLVPEIAAHENRDFEHLSARVPGRTPYSLPWHVGHQSIDLPVRMGEDSYRVIGWGQSSLTVDAGPVTAGLSHESHWWGPGARNAIVLGANAPGFPHGLVRSARPIAIPGGNVEFVWLAGLLHQSLFFDALPEDHRRALSAFTATFTPAVEPGLTLGAARAVYSDLGADGSVAPRAPDALFRWGDVDDREADDPARQVMSVFGRWVLSEAGTEAYAEWGWVRAPSLRRLLTVPHRGQGYTLGLQWTGEVAHRVGLRLHGEVTNLEQDGTWLSDPPPTFYAGVPVPAGYTHRGESLGAAIGPGASSQWAAVDAVSGGWVAGLWGERVRWNNDAYYTRDVGRFYFAHDVSLSFALRAHGPTPVGLLSAELGREKRHNYLFQNPAYFFGDHEAVDVTNWFLRLEIRGASQPRRRLPGAGGR